MGVLKIKTDENTWETIDNLNLASTTVTGNLTVGINNGTSLITLNGKSLQAVIEESAVTVYIHVNSNGSNSYSSTSPSASSSTLMGWFDNAYPTNSKEREKAIKGFLIEHRTTNSGTYHLPYYWNGSSWALLNAIWG